jgi:MYXO-CTERM domain-containing protein
LILLARTAVRPDHGLAGRDPSSPAAHGDVLRLSLRPSATLLAVLTASLFVASAALWTALVPWIGGWQAVPATLAFAAAGALRAVAWCRAQPCFLEIGTDGVRTRSHDGATTANGPLTGCSQWGASLLVLAVGTARQRRRVFVAADAVSVESFRELAVRGRSATGR